MATDATRKNLGALLLTDQVSRDLAECLLTDEDLTPLLADATLRRGADSRGATITPDSLQSLLLRRQRELVEIKKTIRHLLWLARDTK